MIDAKCIRDIDLAKNPDGYCALAGTGVKIR